MEAAIQQARALWIRSSQESEHLTRTERLSPLKCAFTPPNELPQDIWVDEVTYTGGLSRGNMGDDIPSLKLEAGEKITDQGKGYS